jgi:hypothetical protein
MAEPAPRGLPIGSLQTAQLNGAALALVAPETLRRRGGDGKRAAPRLIMIASCAAGFATGKL